MFFFCFLFFKSSFVCHRGEKHLCNYYHRHHYYCCLFVFLLQGSSSGPTGMLLFPASRRHQWAEAGGTRSSKTWKSAPGLMDWLWIIWKRGLFGQMHGIPLALLRRCRGVISPLPSALRARVASYDVKSRRRLIRNLARIAIFPSRR